MLNVRFHNPVAKFSDSMDDCFWPILLKNSFSMGDEKLTAVIDRDASNFLGAY